jgi:hypothetical protein
MVTKILGQRNIWQADLNECEGLGRAVGGYLWQIEAQGVEASLSQLCRGSKIS